MLELEKIKLEKPKKIDMFKKAINDAEERSKQVKTLDFFKISSKKKPSIISKIFNGIFILFFLNIGFGLCSDYYESKAMFNQSNSNGKLYEQIHDELKEKNIVNIPLYRLLKDSPLSSADLLSSSIVIQVLSNDKIPSENKNEVLKIYAANWKSGLEKQNLYYENCQLSIICHMKALVYKDTNHKIEEILIKTAIFAQHPDIFKSYMELKELEVKHLAFFSD